METGGKVSGGVRVIDRGSNCKPRDLRVYVQWQHVYRMIADSDVFWRQDKFPALILQCILNNINIVLTI